MPAMGSFFRYIQELYLVLAPDFTVLDITDLFLSVSGKQRSDAIGKHLFDFWPEHEDRKAEAEELRASIRYVIEHKREHVMSPQRYDVLIDGEVRERYWKSISVPILDDNGDLKGILVRGEDVTTTLLRERDNQRFQNRLLAQDNAAEILDRINDGFFSLDANLNFTNANKVTLDHFKTSLEKLLGRSLNEFSPNLEDRKKFRERYLKVIETGEPIQFSESYSGQILHINAYRTVDGGIAIFYRDVTDSWNNEDRLRIITNQLPTFVGYIDTEGRYQFVNDSYVKWFELPREQIIGKRRDEFFPKETSDLARKYEQMALAGTAVKYENFLSKPDGSYKALDVEYIPHRHLHSGNILGAVIVAHDVTQLKIASQNLLNMLETAPVAIAILEGPEHTYTFTNTQYKKLYNLGDVIGKSIIEVSNNPAKPFHYMTTVYHTGETCFQNEFQNFRKDGTSFFTNFIIQSYQSADVKHKGVMVVAYDVTEQVLSKRKVEDAVKTRDEFLSMASHELKTPLTSMHLHTHIIEKYIEEIGSSDPELPQKFEATNNRIKKGIDRLTHLVNDMLDISKLSHGKLSLRGEKFSLTALVEEVVDRMSPQFAEEKVKLQLELEPNLVGEWDQFRIEQVITNLVTNALKYGDKTSVKLVLKKENNFAVLAVADRGPGISPEHHHRIFERFERLKETEHLQGLGLGLYICKEIVERHKGTIHVESRPQMGATFIVKLPLTNS